MLDQVLSRPKDSHLRSLPNPVRPLTPVKKISSRACKYGRSVARDQVPERRPHLPGWRSSTYRLKVRLTLCWRGESAANSSRKSNSRAAPQWVDSTGIGNDSWCRKSGTGNNRAKTQHFRHFWMSISRLSIARARARERQVFRARAESPNAAGGTSGLTDPLLKSKNYSRKLCG